MSLYNKLALFVGGTLFGSVGIKLLSSKDAKKAYVHATAAGLRMKDYVMEKNEGLKEKPTKRGFINEVVAIGKYNKMYINPKEWTAGSYACLVRQTCDEIDGLNRKKK